MTKGGCWQLDTGGISRVGGWKVENGVEAGKFWVRWKMFNDKRKCKLIFARSAFILLSMENNF